MKNLQQAFDSLAASCPADIVPQGCEGLPIYLGQNRIIVVRAANTLYAYTPCGKRLLDQHYLTSAPGLVEILHSWTSDEPLRQHAKTTYRVVRFWAADGSSPQTIKTGLTRKKAQEHCSREDTHEPGVWFDGYERE